MLVYMIKFVKKFILEMVQTHSKFRRGKNLASKLYHGTVDVGRQKFDWFMKPFKTTRSNEQDDNVNKMKFYSR